jgi:starch synthase
MARKARLTGILNGIDTTVWDPATDPALAQNYTSRTLGQKAVNKQALQERFGLGADTSAPLFSVISRLSEQKGLDLALQALPAILEKGARFVLLGSGAPDLEEGFRALARRYPDRVGVEIGFNEDLAHLMQAGADATLVPSRFEPCGLTQLCAMRYGTLPIVSVTGGLADTVIDANEAALAAGCATGFQFAPTSATKLGDALDRAMALFGDTKAWQKIQRNAMKHPVGWDSSAARMAEIYRELAER